MNIEIIRGNEDLKSVHVRGGKLLETSVSSDADGSFFHYSIYDPEKETASEIAPEIIKYSFIPAVNCIWKSETVYFASYEQLEGTDIIISLYAYDVAAGKTEKVTEFEEKKNLITNIRRSINIFVLTESLILVQTEHQKSFDVEGLMGNIEFSQFTINLNTQVRTDVKDINLINNGVNSIIPVSENYIMLKTGFSFLEDERLVGKSENEALIESVYYGTMSEFIANLPLENSANSSMLLAVAYYDRIITSPKMADDHIFFTVIDHRNRTGESIFFNFATGETIKCQTIGTDTGDADAACVIDGTLFIRRNLEGRTEFIDARTSLVDCTFEGEDFVGSLGRLLFFSRVKGRRKLLRAYRFPRLDLVFEEEGRYLAGCISPAGYHIYLTD